MLFRDSRIQALGHRVDDVVVLNGHEDGIPQVLISFDMGRHTDLMDDFRHPHFQAAARGNGGLGGADGFHPLFAAQRQNAFGHFVGVEGLEKVIVGTGQHGLPLQVVVIKAGHHHKLRLGSRGGLYAFDHADSVEAGQKEIHDNHVGMPTLDTAEQLAAVFFDRFHIQTMTAHDVRTRDTKMLTVICQQHLDLVFHLLMLPQLFNFHFLPACIYYHILPINTRGFQVFLRKKREK